MSGPPSCQIGGDDSAGGADLIGQPQCHGPDTAPDFQAAPPRGHAEVGEVADRRAVEQELQTAQTVTFPLPGPIEDILAHCHLPDGRTVDYQRTSVTSSHAPPR